jgi:hypothetical protein
MCATAWRVIALALDRSRHIGVSLQCQNCNSCLARVDLWTRVHLLPQQCMLLCLTSCTSCLIALSVRTRTCSASSAASLSVSESVGKSQSIRSSGCDHYEAEMVLLARAPRSLLFSFSFPPVFCLPLLSFFFSFLFGFLLSLGLLLDDFPSVDGGGGGGGGGSSDES